MINEIERARSALNHIDAGCSREEWVRIGMAVKAAGLGYEDFHVWSQTGSNYAGEKDCKSVWGSFQESGGITAATLFGLAFEKGWKDPRKIRLSGRNAYEEPTSGQNVKMLQKLPGEATSASALGVWERCLPASSTHEYILRKHGRPDGLRYYPSTEPPLIIHGQNVTDYLVVPCWSDEELQTLQFIPPGPDLKKLNLAGASLGNGYFALGSITDRVYICEGIGQAWAVIKASGFPAVVCFSASRMTTVAKILRSKYPRARLVIVPDRGKEIQASEVASAVMGQWVELPQDKPSNYDVNDYAQDHGHEKLALVLEHLKGPENRFKLLSGVDLFNSPPMRWLVRGVIPVEGLAALYGASGSGKSFLILDMAFAIAGGQERWFGLGVTKAPVTYVCLEGEAGIGKRIKAWSLYFNKPVPDDLRFIVQTFNLLSADVSELANAITFGGGGGGLVVLDTLNRAAPGADENSSVDMGKIIAAAKELQSLIGGVVLLVHHTGKDATKGLRGHSSLYAALDGAIEVIKTDTCREWSVAKSKDEVTGNSIPFKLEIVTVGADADGDEITSCVAVFDGSREVTQRKNPLRGGNQKTALKILTDEINKSAHTGKEGAPLLSKCISYEEALSVVAEQIPADAKYRKLRAREAIDGLVKKQYLGKKGDWLWKI